ncbi:MAG: hypothetical protein AB7Q81_11890 [Gammaproteobacteria bacterium]
MTPREASVELLARIGANAGEAVYIRADELASWPTAPVMTFKAEKLLLPACTAADVVCPGCERQCAMPVAVTHRASGEVCAFVVCAKRDDVSRVAVSLESLAQWQASASTVADWLSLTLGLMAPGGASINRDRWEVGLYRGNRHSAHLVMRVVEGLVLELAGHALRVVDVVDVKGTRIVVDRRALNQAIDHPVAGGGDAESAEQRRARLIARLREEKAKGTKAFLRVVAAEEGISPTRLKQIVAEPR